MCSTLYTRLVNTGSILLAALILLPACSSIWIEPTSTPDPATATDRRSREIPQVASHPWNYDRSWFLPSTGVSQP